MKTVFDTFADISGSTVAILVDILCETFGLDAHLPESQEFFWCPYKTIIIYSIIKSTFDSIFTL